MAGDETQDLWREYTKTKDQGVRDRLILTYAPLVKYVAGRLGSGLPAHVDEGDLASYGLLGLISAIERSMNAPIVQVRARVMAENPRFAAWKRPREHPRKTKQPAECERRTDEVPPGVQVRLEAAHGHWYPRICLKIVCSEVDVASKTDPPVSVAIWVMASLLASPNRTG
jgi:hypothetical protein